MVLFPGTLRIVPFQKATGIRILRSFFNRLPACKAAVPFHCCFDIPAVSRAAWERSRSHSNFIARMTVYEKPACCQTLLVVPKRREAVTRTEVKDYCFKTICRMITAVIHLPANSVYRCPCSDITASLVCNCQQAACTPFFGKRALSVPSPFLPLALH